MSLKRYYLIDIARGIAALSVVIFHYRIFYEDNISFSNFVTQEQPFYKYLFFFYENGWIAVQFFFIISGFIFYLLYSEKIKRKQISAKDFIKFRFSRLYPLHFLTLILMVLIFYFSNIGNFTGMVRGDFKHFILNIFLIQKWGFEDFGSFNDPSWSVSIEILLYSVFFIVFFFKKNDYLVTFLFLILSPVIFYFNKFIGYGIYCFFIGGLTYLIYKKISYNLKYLKISLILGIIINISSILSFFYIDNSIIIKIISFTFFFPSIIIVLMLIQLLFNKAGSIFQIIGDVSYSIYLLHYVVQAIIKIILYNFNLKIDFNSNFIFLSYVLLVYILGILSYNFYEKPIQNYIRAKY